LTVKNWQPPGTKLRRLLVMDMAAAKRWVSQGLNPSYEIRYLQPSIPGRAENGPCVGFRRVQTCAAVAQPYIAGLAPALDSSVDESGLS